jgi:4a-hydroxytetrahydrobiopterin dehydratase
MLSPMAVLSDSEIRQKLASLAGWTLGDGAISRKLTFPSFPDAIAFTTRLAFEAEASDHHPDILINFKRVTLTYSTHSEGGLTAKDFEGAARADSVAAAMGGK